MPPLPRAIFLLALALAALALAAGCGEQDEDIPQEAEVTTDVAGTDTAVAGEEAVEVELAEQNDSGESGIAELVVGSTKGETKVVIELEGAPEHPQPAHIHTGTCEELGDVAFPLESVENGTSETTVDASVEELQQGEFAINVHESEAEIGTYVACGEID